jgi:D-cysteine desulfhydrase
MSSAAPLEPLHELERRVRAEVGARSSAEPWLWIKEDDVADGLVGGNKARKLEYLLGEAHAQGARAVVTSGRYGTNLGLSTADAAHRMGLATTIVLAPAPVSEAVRRKLLALHASGAQLRFHSTLAGAILDVAWLRLEAMLQPGGGTYYIPPSGTSDVGSIGYVNAFFELLEQTGERDLPDEIVIAASTGGTAAGLLAGMCLSGQWGRTRLRAVPVTEGLLQSEWLLRREARDTFRAVRDALDPSDRARAVECDFDSPSALTYVRGYLAPGYGLSDPTLDGIIRLLRDTQGVPLDPTYTAKAMRHFLDRARERLRSGDTKRRLLFWNTYAPVDVEAVIRNHRWSDSTAPWRDLPAGFHPLFSDARPERVAAPAPSSATAGRTLR